VGDAWAPTFQAFNKKKVFQALDLVEKKSKCHGLLQQKKQNKTQAYRPLILVFVEKKVKGRMPPTLDPFNKIH